MERFVAESDAYRQQSVQDLLTLKGKTVVVTGMYEDAIRVLMGLESHIG